MATKYDVLITLIDKDHEAAKGLVTETYDYLVVQNIIRLIAEEHGSEEALADAIYDLVADSYAETEQDEE